MKLLKQEVGEKSTVKIEFSVDKEVFDKAVDKVYRKQVKKINVPGFRAGKAPRAIIEKMYGSGVFYEDAINDLIPENYTEACKEIYGKEPNFYVIHAGLECGVMAYNIAQKGGKADIIAIGPNMRLVHSPNEYMELSSLDRLMQVSVRLLEILGK